MSTNTIRSSLAAAALSVLPVISNATTTAPDTSGVEVFDANKQGLITTAPAYGEDFSAADYLLESGEWVSKGFDTAIAQGQQYAAERKANAEALKNRVFTELGPDGDGDTVFRISAPDADAMSIHTATRGVQVRKESPTYVVQGEKRNEQIITFVGLDIEQYKGTQIIHSHGRTAGEEFILGDLIEQGRGRASENARYFTVNDSKTGELVELQAGIGYPMLPEGDWVKGTEIIIENAAGEVKTFDVTEYIMDAERMAALNVKAGGDGTIPTDHINISITPGADGVLESIQEALSEPGATLKFAADSGLGTRWVSQDPHTFGKTWNDDITLGQEIAESGAKFNVPLSKVYERIVYTDFKTQLDHNISSCPTMNIGPDQIEQFDFYEAGLGEFAGMYPRNEKAVIATLAGTFNVVAYAEKYMAGINASNPLEAGITWNMTGSAENVSLTMTPEDALILTHGCTIDNNGTVRPEEPKTNYYFGGRGGNGTGSAFGFDVGTGTTIIPGTIITTGGTDPETPVSPVPLPPSMLLLAGGLGLSGLFARRNRSAASPANDTFSGLKSGPKDTVSANALLTDMRGDFSATSAGIIPEKLTTGASLASAKILPAYLQLAAA